MVDEEFEKRMSKKLDKAFRNSTYGKIDYDFHKSADHFKDSLILFQDVYPMVELFENVFRRHKVQMMSNIKQYYKRKLRRHVK